MAALTAGVRTLAGRARFFGSIAPSAAVLVAALAAFRRGKPVDAGVKPSGWQTVLKGAGLVSTLWQSARRVLIKRTNGRIEERQIHVTKH